MKFSRRILILAAAAIILSPSLSADEKKIPVGAVITVHWRIVQKGNANALLDQKCEFDSRGTVRAVKSPSGEGGVTGSSIVRLIRKIETRGRIAECRALLFGDGGRASSRKPRSAIAVIDDGSLYDAYVSRNGKGFLEMFVFVLVE